MPNPTATDAQGALSDGTLTNPAFTAPAKVGDIAYADIAPAAGYGYGDGFVIPGVAHIAMSTDGVTFGAEGEGLTIDAFNATTRIYFRAESVTASPVVLSLPASGFYLIGATGHVSDTDAATGAVTLYVAIESASGNVGDTDAVRGAATLGVVAPDAFTPTVRFDNGDHTNNRVTVLAQTTDPQGGTLTYRYAVTASATPPSDWAPYSGNESAAASGNSTFKVVTGLTLPGTYYAHVRCTDAEGNSTVGTSKMFFADNFNRANDATGLGAAWTKLGTTTMTISSNTAAKPTFDALYGIAGLASETDGAVQCTTAGAATALALFLRASNLSNHYRVEATTSTNVRVTKVVAGSSTTLKDITVPALSVGHTIAADMVGNKIRVYTGTFPGGGLTRRDADDITDSAIASGYFGIGSWVGGSGAVCDDFDYRRL